MAEDDRSDPPPLTTRDQTFHGDRAARPWTWRLAIFLRILAVAEIVKGLVHWATVIGAGGADPAAAGTAQLFEHVVFAVADPVAAVGLWVGAAWGVAIWLIAAIAQLLAIWLGGAGPLGWALASVILAVMAAYVALSIKARNETS